MLGNKVDKLPIDGPHFEARWKDALLDAFVARTGVPEREVAHVALVSALNGYGMNRLLDFLLSKNFNSFGACIRF